MFVFPANAQADCLVVLDLHQNDGCQMGVLPLFGDTHWYNHLA